ncbi:MAG: hypothetical protein ACFFCW_40830 [Candidatus Hodarchaeota archaeon]
MSVIRARVRVRQEEKDVFVERDRVRGNNDRGPQTDDRRVNAIDGG